MTLTVVILGPLFVSTGYWLAGDMVFVPHQPWKPAWLGMDGSLPRAVPMDAVVSALTYVLPGWAVQRLLMVGAFVLGGLGAGMMVGASPWFARLGAITLFVWNPWVYERLLIGQWAILSGYLALPWVVVGVRGLRERTGSGVAGLSLAILWCSVCSPITGLMASAVALILLGARPLGRFLKVVAVCCVANLPWVVPSLLAAATIHVDQKGFEAFAPGAEGDAGRVATFLSLGGIWKESIVPGERASTLVVLCSCIVTLCAVGGLVLERNFTWVRRLALTGGAAFLVVVFAATPTGSAVLADLGRVVPPMAMLRDTHRLLAIFALALLPGFAGFLSWLGGRARERREALASVVAGLALSPILLLPSLAWGAAGELETSVYPGEWAGVADRLSSDPGTVVVLPWTGSYRGFAWSHRRAVLDPAPRYLPGDVLVDDRVFVEGHVVETEEPSLSAVGRALKSPDPATRRRALRAQGVRWVLVEEGNGVRSTDLPAGSTVHDGTHLRLIDMGATDPVERSQEALPPIVAANALAAAMGILACLLLLRNMYAARQHKGGTCL